MISELFEKIYQALQRNFAKLSVANPDFYSTNFLKLF